MLKQTLIGGLAGLALAASGCAGGGSHHGPSVPALASAPTRIEIGRNVVRIPGLSPSDVSSAAVLASYDPTLAKPRHPEGWVLVPDDNWRAAVVASQFAAQPVSAGLLSINRQYIPTAPGDVLARVKATGFPKAKGLKVLVLDKAGSDVYVDLQDLDLKPTALSGNPVGLASTLVPFRGGWAGAYSDSVVIVSADARDYALPAAAWSAYSGDTIAFVHRDDVPKATRALLVQREKLRLRKPSIYVIGPSSVVSGRVAAQLARYGPVHRVAGPDAVATSVALARYHDPSTGFGWGLTHGPASVSLVDTGEWPNAVGAFDFAASGPQAPVLLTDGGATLPPALTKYLGDLRTNKPNQAYVFASTSAISSKAVADLDGMLDARG